VKKIKGIGLIVKEKRESEGRVLSSEGVRIVVA
jgi:hypothetical protein